MRKLIVFCAVLAVGVFSFAVAGLAEKPPSPPGKDPCEHGNAQKPCRPDPQPTHGKDCDHHGNEGGVNEDHCKGEINSPPTQPPTTSSPPVNPPVTPPTTSNPPSTQPSQPNNPAAPPQPTQPQAEVTPAQADKPTSRQSAKQVERVNPKTGQKERAYKGNWHPVIQGSG